MSSKAKELALELLTTIILEEVNAPAYEGVSRCEDGECLIGQIGAGGLLHKYEGEYPNRRVFKFCPTCGERVNND